MFIKLDDNLDDKCVLAALSLALGKSTDEVYKQLIDVADDLPHNVEAVWGKLLLADGYNLVTIPAVLGKQRCTVEKLLSKSYNAALIAKCAAHVVFITEGNYYDIDENTKYLNVLHYYIKNKGDINALL